MVKEYYLADYLLRELQSNEAKKFVIHAIKKNPGSNIGGTSSDISDDVLEYNMFIDRVFQEGVLLQTSPAE